MSIQKSHYFYDKQIRRYLLQVIRIFSGFSVNNGVDPEGATKYKLVPCTYADMSRLGATYLTNNSENVLQSAPMMSIHIADFQPSPEYRHAPHLENTSRFTEKQRDVNGDYINKPGKKYTVQQLMPVPFTMNINLDIWTTSTDQKLELIEQLLVWFNPGYEFAVSSSPFDVGRICNIELDNIAWTSRSVPQSSAVEIDVATLTFKLFPVFISSPAKIKRQTLIHTVQTNLATVENIFNNSLDDIFNSQDVETSNIVVTPSGYDLEVYKQGGEYYSRLYHPEGYGRWPALFAQYGEVAENETYMKIRQTTDHDDDTADIFARYEITEDDTIIKMHFDEDTFRPTTLDPVNKIINPNNGVPVGFQIGTRYLIGATIEIVDWNVTAHAWDIIEYTEDGWVVAFDSQSETDVQYIINLNKMDLYTFDPEEKIWISAVMGTYQEGYWLFDIQKVINC